MTSDLLPLFDPSWLSIPPDAGHDDVLRRIDEAERRAGEALARLMAEAGTPAGPADLDARIDALLALETRSIPEGAKTADEAVERATMEIGFRRRALFPHFHALADRIRVLHRQALVACRDARWALMTRRALADPGGPSSPLQGAGTRYVKSDRYDARAARALSPIERVRADRTLKRLGENPVPPELGLRPLDGGGETLWAMTAGHPNRFILRRGEAAGVPCFVLEDVGPHAGYDEWGTRR
ncbi:hypothetical protein [Azospirillum rugosum]|uniref:Uncharacterized protein n=1 Tax=Azospirillum rugosum TaxID=416170 RepID=A0ABS4SIH3_9PROT|nr:hypothetical protein [Azospirillum rugosum]MBP2292366.1 hypothetical protein [Azospirillum rugosum]MDQ0526125.1 hypothetical protein [Azospirillum rugosum]